MKIAVLTDSSSDLFNQQVNNLFVLPLPIIFPDQIIIEDNKANDKVQTKILNNLDYGNLKTSALNPGILQFKMLDILQEYDHIIYLPIAYNLSSQYDNSLILLNNSELNKRLTIVKHYFTGIQLGNFILSLLPILPNVCDIKTLKLDSLVKQWGKNSLVTVIPGDINLLVQGGRANKLIIKFLNKKNLKVAVLWSHKPKKIISKDYQKLIDKYCLNLKNYFKNNDDFILYLAHTRNCNQDIIKICVNEFAKYQINVNFTSLATIFGVHGGSNTIGLVAFKRIKL